MNALQIIVLALTTWRIATMVVNEDGPWFVFVKIRRLVGIYLERTHSNRPDGTLLISERKHVDSSFFSQLLSCVWCFSVWVGAAWTVFYFVVSPTIVTYCALPFALSAVSVFMELLVDKLKKPVV